MIGSFKITFLKRPKESFRESNSVTAVLIDSLAIYIFCGLRYLQRFIAKDIQSRSRILRERKDVFKELKILVEKRKVALHKDILEHRHNFVCTNKFYSTILVNF